MADLRFHYAGKRKIKEYNITKHKGIIRVYILITAVLQALYTEIISFR